METIEAFFTQNPYSLFISFPFLLFSFYLLHFFSEYYFIPSLDEVGKKLKMSSDISGSTLMAIGSSAPELAVMLISISKSGNHEAIGIGTIVGSALFNLFVITGAVMIVMSKARLIWQPLIRDLLFYAIAAVILIFSFKDEYITEWEAVIFIFIYMAYIFIVYFWKKVFPYKDIEQIQNEDSKEMPSRHEIFAQKFLNYNFYLVFLVSILIISILSWILVELAILIAAVLGIPEFIVALTIIAVGTSVPDLVSSVIVAKQGRAGMAINNGIGSNIFDILIGLGLPFLLLFWFTGTQSINVSAADINLAFIFLMGSLVILLTIFLISKWQTKRSAGYLLILFYLVYLLYEVLCEMGKVFCF
jgi:K+-dependent Na+/Ca+ exchanger-like protein